MNELLEAEWGCLGDEGGEQEMGEATSMGWGGQEGVGGTRRRDINVRHGSVLLLETEAEREIETGTQRWEWR